MSYDAVLISAHTPSVARFTQRYQSTVLKAKKVQQVQNQHQFLKKIVKRFQENTQVKPYCKLSEYQKGVINDAGSQYSHDKCLSQKAMSSTIGNIEQIYQEIKEQSLISRTFKTFSFLNLVNAIKLIRRHKKNYTPILKFTVKPTNPMIIVWNTLKIFIILHTFFSYPMQDTFGDVFRILENQYQSLIIFEQIFFVIDMLLQFHIEVIQDGDLISRYKNIAQLYMTKGFYIDLLSLSGLVLNRIISVNYISAWLQLFKYVFFLQLRQLNKYFKVLLHEFDHIESLRTYFKLLKLFVVVLMFSHIVACFWIFISSYSTPYADVNWLNSRGLNILNTNDMQSIYAQSMYFASMTMTTVGYGDIHPYNNYEYWASIIIMQLSCWFFGYNLNTITLMMQELQKPKIIQRQKLEIISKYMRRKKIDKNLQNRIYNYLKSRFDPGSIEQFQGQEEQVFNSLNNQLKDEFTFQDKGKILLKIPLFFRHFSVIQIQKLTKFVKERQFTPKENIVIENKSLIYIYSGELELINERKKEHENEIIPIFTLKKGQYIGVKALFGFGSKYQLKSKTHSQIYILSQKDFCESFQDSASIQDFENFCMIKDRVTDSHLYNDLDLQCNVCDQSGHEFEQCQKIFYQPQLQYIASRFNMNIVQIRKVKQRSLTRSSNSLANQVIINRVGREFIRIQSQNLSDIQSENISLLKTPAMRDDSFDAQNRQNDDSSQDSWCIPESFSSEEKINSKPLISSFRHKIFNTFTRDQVPKKTYRDLPFISQRDIHSKKKPTVKTLMPKEESMVGISVELIEIRNNLSEIDNFETMQSYSTYSPEYNIENIIMKMNIAQKQNKRKLQQHIRKHRLKLIIKKQLIRLKP